MSLIEYKSIAEIVVTGTTGLSAIVATVIAIATLREVKKQRESSYYPDLYLSFFPGTRIRIQDFGRDQNDFSIITSNDSDEEIELHGLVHAIENIGLGTAKNIVIEWSFDKAQATQLIKSAIKQPFQFEHDYDTVWIKNPEGDTIFSTSFYTYENIVKYDFVLPRKDERFQMSPALPREIVGYYLAYFIAKRELYPSSTCPLIVHEDFKSFPAVKAKLSYSDIGNKSFTKNFLVQFAMSLSNFDNNPDVLKNTKIEIRLFVDVKSSESTA